MLQFDRIFNFNYFNSNNTYYYIMVAEGAIRRGLTLNQSFHYLIIILKVLIIILHRVVNTMILITWEVSQSVNLY